MGTVHRLPIAAPPLTEAELDAMIEDKRRAQADADLLRAQAAQARAHEAALQAADRFRRMQGQCPPCHGNCSQGDFCHSRLPHVRDLQRTVRADAAGSGLPTSPRWLLLYAAVLAAAVLASTLFPQAWGGA